MLVLVIVGAYLAVTLAIGYLARRHTGGASEFLHARGSMPFLVTAFAFLAANCGALEIVGIVAATAKYGVLALHFYWIGAIPAMVFLALFMLPVYLRSGAMTVPDFLRLRYNKATHVLSAVSLGIMMIFVSGIGLYAIATVLGLLFGQHFFSIVILGAIVVVIYILVGGLRSTIYNQVFQLFLTIAGLAPLTYLVYRQFSNGDSPSRELPSSMTHLWMSLSWVQPKAGVMDVVGVVLGLGFILSFGYWCTDFLLIQRALAARTDEGTIRTPLLAALAKMIFPVLIVLPGMAAAAAFRTNGTARYDLALPLLMQHYYGHFLLSIGIAAILASLMSGLAGNIHAFATLWTHDLYRGYLRPNQEDRHYLHAGRAFILLAASLSVASAYIASHYNNLMDYLQLLFSLFNAPLFATFLLGMFTTWATPAAGFWGLLCGLLATGVFNFLLRLGVIGFGSQMSANFYGAMLGWTVCMVATIALSRWTQPRSREQLAGLTCFTQEGKRLRTSASSWGLAVLVLAVCAALNFLFR